MTLKELRKNNGLTQAQAAELLDIGLRAYQTYERGEHRPKPCVVDRIADLFGLTIAERYEMFYASKSA